MKTASDYEGFGPWDRDEYTIEDYEESADYLEWAATRL
jgi:hypothetical protein